MYLSYYPIGTAGHRASSLFSYAPYASYGNAPYVQNSTMANSLASPFHKPSVYSRPQAPVPQPAPEQVNGGINAVLEYDTQNMSAFLCWCAFGMLGQTRNPSKEFENVVVSILHATRLPKSTLIIALEYLNQRFSNSPSGPMSELDIFLKVVIALVLANKFNDDNTFTNRSWSGATGLKIEQINAEERLWLQAVSWQLNVVHFQPNIHTLEECWRTWMEKFACAPVSPPVSTPPSYSASVSPSQAYNYSSVPSSPAYDVANESSPINFTYDWSAPRNYMAQPIQYNVRANPYVPVQQSIWSYTPNQYQYVPQVSEQNYYGYANPYYNCSVATC